MLRFAMEIGHCNPCASTASAALMKGWINSIFISGPRARSLRRSAILTHHVLDHFVQDFRLYRLLHEMTGSALQRRHNFLLISDRGHHDNARFGMLLHNLLGSLDPLHLGHRDVHQHDVRRGALIFGYSGHTVSRFARHLATEGFDHSGQILTREDGIVHYQVADWLTILSAFHWCKLLHIQPPANIRFRHPVLACRIKSVLADSSGFAAVVGSCLAAGPAIVHALGLQGIGQRVERYHSHRITTLDGRLGHAINYAGFFALRDRHPARCLDQAQTLCPVLSHSGHEDSDALVSKFFRHTLEQNIYRWPMPVYARFIVEHGDVAQRQSLYLEVAVSGADQSPASQQKVTRLHFLDRNGTDFLQSAGEHFGEAL